MKRFRPRAKGRASQLKNHLKNNNNFRGKKKQKVKIRWDNYSIGLRLESTEDGTQLGLQEKDFEVL